MSGNVHVRLREKGGGQKWPCCTSLPSSMGSALSFLGESYNDPWAPRFGQKGMDFGWVESKTRWDVYAIFNLIEPNIENPVPGLDIKIHQANLIYFQIDSDLDHTPETIVVRHSEKSSVETSNINYGPIALMKSWKVTGGNSSAFEMHLKH